MADSDGYIPFFIVTGVIGALAGGIIGYATTGTWRGALTGAAIGGVVGLTGGAVASKLIVGSALAKTSSVVYATRVLLGTAAPVAASTWQQAEQALQNAYEGVKKAVHTPYGQRVIDSATGFIAREAKYGYQGLSSFIKQEVMKDAYLRAHGYVVEWHFYWSQISNTGGPSGPLYQALKEAGIKIIQHF